MGSCVELVFVITLGSSFQRRDHNQQCPWLYCYMFEVILEDEQLIIRLKKQFNIKLIIQKWENIQHIIGSLSRKTTVQNTVIKELFNSRHRGIFTLLVAAFADCRLMPPLPLVRSTAEPEACCPARSLDDPMPGEADGRGSQHRALG